MKRRAMTIITFQNHATTHANAKTAELRNLNSTITLKMALNTHTGGMGDATDEYEPDFKGAKRRDVNIMSTLGNSYF